MSKLSKFKSTLSMKSAAKLLSDLIGEEVNTEDLFSLYEGGWIRLFRPCHGELIKLKPMLDAELHEVHTQNGRYFMESDYVAGVCFGLSLPCDSAQVSMHTCYALRDEEGGFYAIKDGQTDEYLSPYDEFDQENIKTIAITADIYELARKANANEMPEKPIIDITANENCIIITNDNCIEAGKTIYNFSPNENPALLKPAPVTTQETLPPSLRITVAALLEAATNDRKNNTQASLIDSILERNKGIRGLSESSLQKHFSDSNSALTQLRKEAQI